MSQLQEVLKYMQETGPITSIDAIKMFGATRLSAIIYDLKAKGHDIESEMVSVVNRYGKTTRVSSYTLEAK
jgi:hypothetical protein